MSNVIGIIKVCNFVCDLKRIHITLDTRHRYVSFTGEYAGALGQIQDELKDVNDNNVLFISTVWNALHLKPVDELTTDMRGLLQGVIDAMDKLDGLRIPLNTDGGNAKEFVEPNFNNNSETIDSRDIIERIEYLTEFLADIPNATRETYEADKDSHGDRYEAVCELQTLRELESIGQDNAADWRYGETLIRDTYFKTYAKELAEEIGAINKNSSWPNKCIDWDQAARELQHDYSLIEFAGVSYWIR